MKKIILFIVSSLFVLNFISSANNNIMYDKANQLYHNKNYDSAAQLYQQMINDGYCSADLYYNAGNAYYRLNKIGLSIWCYEKALSIHRDKNYLENLKLAKQRIREPIDELGDIFFIRWWEQMYGCFSSNTWAWFALILFLIAMSGLVINRLNFSFQAPRWITSTCIALSMICLLMLSVRTYNDNYHFRGIIVEPKTLLTFSSNKEPIYLSEGIKVKVVERYPKKNTTTDIPYVVVKLPDGRTGRIDRRSMMKL